MARVLVDGEPVIRTPDQRLRVFVSSTLGELAEERAAVRAAIERLHLIPVMFELGARPHPPRSLYRAYLAQSHVFVGLYWQRYGWVAPGEDVSGLEDEYRLAGDLPQLVYLKDPAPDREPRLQALLDRVTVDDRTSYRRFRTPDELAALLTDDLAVLLTERFESASQPAREDEAPPSVPRRAHTTPPVPLTPTVGRDHQIAEVARLVAEERVRLVTLTGPGGIGKSRLSLEVARRVGDAFPDGVHHVPLEPVSDPALVLRAIADRLGVVGEARQAVDDMLVRVLQDQQLLLVIDNFEHVIGAARDLSAVLDRCVGVQALVSSRQPLRVRGETEYPVPPLQAPDDTARAGAASGVQLFVQRARAVRPDFVLTEQNAPAVAELIRRLDGLPLAIELAAARTRLLPPDALLERLETRLDVLASGAVDLPERQRTLRATIDWSYHLLDPAEQQLLDRLSQFAGGATIAAVEAVCGEDGIDVLETLSSLMEKSLLVSSTTTGEPRVHLLWTVRAYAGERLTERGEAALIADRHADWFLRRIGLVEPFRDPTAHGRFDQMLDEYDDIRAAMDWVVHQRDAHRTAAFAAAGWVWFWLTGRVSEVRSWFDAAGALAADPATTDRDRGRLLYTWGQVLELMGEQERCVEVVTEAVAVLEQVGDEVGATAARLILSAALPHLGRGDEGDAEARAALAVAERLGEPHLIGYACAMIGTAQTLAGDLRAARETFARQAAAARTVDFQILEAQALAQAGLVELLDDRWGQAWARFHEAGEALRASGSLEVLSYWCEFAARAVLDEGDAVTALDLLLAAEDLRVQLGLGSWPRWAPVHDQLMDEAAEALGPDAFAARADRPRDAWELMEQVLAGHP